MRRVVTVLFVVALSLPLAGIPAGAHCEMPCGIYDDQIRFERMMQDTATITKAMSKVVQVCGKPEPQAKNQTVRWVTTKEKHAQDIQDTMARYFMTQRIKAPTGDDAQARAQYVDRLTKAHQVLQAAMRCKQTVDATRAKELENAIRAFHAAYTSGKAAVKKPAEPAANGSR